MENPQKPLDGKSIEAIEAWEILAATATNVESLARFNLQALDIAGQLINSTPKNQQVIDAAFVAFNKIIGAKNVTRILEDREQHLDLEGVLADAQREIRKKAKQLDPTNILEIETPDGEGVANILYGPGFYGTRANNVRDRVEQLKEIILPLPAMEILKPHLSPNLSVPVNIEAQFYFMFPHK